MDFFVVKVAGKQFLVSPGDIFSVDADLGKMGEKIVLDQVLLTSVDNKTTVGTPLVSGAKVRAEIVFSGKGEKIRVAKFKAKSRYRRVMGFRPMVTKLKVLGFGEREIRGNTEKLPKVNKRLVPKGKK